GSIAGVLIADYWLVKRKHLVLEDLYLPDGIYRYRNGWNWNAVAATVAGCALAWGGLIVPFLKPLYSYAWFVGVLVSGGTYYALELRRGPHIARELSASAAS
ncbi:MAG: cytosine permease, partial [bacterium]